MCDALTRARAYEAAHGDPISPQQRPGFHLSPRVGWMNDPNGFSFYGGMYHLFYQYHPYQTAWGPMHWGHARSLDLLHWEFLPAALAPDAPYDAAGCFSGSAGVLPDGRQLLLYTGVRPDPQAQGRFLQTQCAAVGDGVEYEKYPLNPVLAQEALPPGASLHDFRDPKLWQTPDGGFCCVAGTCLGPDHPGIPRFRSPDGLHWQADGILAEDQNGWGIMWECPDFFPLDGRQVLLVSAVGLDQVPTRETELSGNHTLCLIGREEADGRLTAASMQAVDCGLDFYAAQTLRAPDGRRIMVAWMQNWAALDYRPQPPLPWFGQMTLPRELSVREGRLVQTPVRELNALRGPVQLRETRTIRGVWALEAVRGPMLDLTLDAAPAEDGPGYEYLTLEFTWDGGTRLAVRYCPAPSLLTLERSGPGLTSPHVRACRVDDRGGRLHLRAILDRYSLELFVHGGEQALSCVVYPTADAPAVRLCAQGSLEARVEIFPLLPAQPLYH